MAMQRKKKTRTWANMPKPTDCIEKQEMIRASNDYTVAKTILSLLLLYHGLRNENPLTSLCKMNRALRLKPYSYTTSLSTTETQPSPSSSQQPYAPNLSPHQETTESQLSSYSSPSMDSSSSQHPHQANPSPPQKMYKQKGTSKKKYKLTHMHAVFAWPPGFCKKYKCWPETNMHKFYVHGIWPADNEGRHLIFCPIPFDPTNKDEPFETMGDYLMKESYQYWPSYNDTGKFQNQHEASPNLWRHEYMKHGSCARDALGISLVEYFELVLQFAKLNIEDSLLTAGLLDAPTSTYTAKDFSRALEQDFGETNIKLSCHKQTNELAEIILCIDGITRLLTSCPEYKRDFKCTETTVIFHKGF